MGGREYKKTITLQEGGDEVTIDLDNLNDGELLRRNGNQIDTVPTPIGTVPAGSVIGDALVWNGAAWILLPAGQDGYVITSNGPGSLPAYQSTGALAPGSVVTDSLDFIGQGETGPNKTTTVFNGAVLAEEFTQIGDRLYTNWALPPLLDDTKDVVLRIHFYLDSIEVAGTAVSFNASMGSSNGQPLNAIIGTIPDQDVLVGPQWIDAHASFTLDAATYLQFAAQEAVNFRLERIVNGAAPQPVNTQGPRVHLITVDWTVK